MMSSCGSTRIEKLSGTMSTTAILHTDKIVAYNFVMTLIKGRIRISESEGQHSFILSSTLMSDEYNGGTAVCLLLTVKRTSVGPDPDRRNRLWVVLGAIQETSQKYTDRAKV